MRVRTAMRVFLGVVCASVIGVASADAPKGKRPPAKKDGLPPGVTMLARGVWGGGASPDGTRFAHFTGMRTRKLRIVTIDGGKAVEIETGEGSCTASACLDDRCGRIEWSGDGSRVALRTDDGLWEVDVAAGTRRQVDTAAARAICDFRFAADGVLEFVAPGVKAMAVWRDGQAESVVELPPTANAHELGDDVIVTGRWEAFDGRGAAWTDLWIVDRTRKKIRRVYHRDPSDPDDRTEPMGDPRLSPDEDRVCWQGRGVHCTSTKTGVDTVISATAGELPGRWGHERTLPFSPSGRLLAFRVAGEGGDSLMVHDFVTGKTRDVLAPLRHQDHVFQGEDLILMYEQEDYRDKSIPPIARLDLRDDSETSVVSSAETEYNVAVVVPGRTDVLFIGRERPKTGSRDLVRIDVDAAIEGAAE